MAEGLDKSGGISFSRKPKAKEKEPYGLAEPKEPEEEVEEPKRIDTEELLKSERLNAKLSTAKNINLAGFGVNTSTIFSLLFYVDSLLVNPDTIMQLNMINEMFDLEIDFEKIITTIQTWKMEIISLCVSSQTFIYAYKDLVSKQAEQGNEDFMEVLNNELGKVI